jgi:hypothetical protein
MAYRAIDTLLEKVVLLLALIGVVACAGPFWGSARIGPAADPTVH